MYGAAMTEQVAHAESNGGNFEELQEHGATSHEGVDHATKGVIGASPLFIFCECVFESLSEGTAKIVWDQISDDSCAFCFDGGRDSGAVVQKSFLRCFRGQCDSLH
ncbi:hypothetical protein LBMAG46_40180 [Planctomycetia bacterium]|nr:hypothetical protein LBMAG46_40180 [Planctomycetia bacterium]